MQGTQNEAIIWALMKRGAGGGGGDLAALGVAPLVVPAQDGVLRDDVVVVQAPHDVAEELQQLAVLVAEYLHPPNWVKGLISD